ncbi:damage-control phosphatase ARMT1 family protein [Longispora sp. K20-0274]|uniref:damage-control phosphatase ARMT1 family protein n=1 Tax=Longispora sp. K20-0274 TaxID=3088255 RepID=UPI00399B2FB5
MVPGVSAAPSGPAVPGLLTGRDGARTPDGTVAAPAVGSFRFGVAESPAVVTSAVPGSFPWSVLHDRHPKLVAGVRDAHPYGPDQRRALDALVAETLTGVVERLPAGEHDAGQWEAWGAGHYGRRWFDVPFLWAESYFYRRLLHAVGYFQPGPWQGVDPFGYLKSAEARGAGAGLGGAVTDPAVAPESSPAPASEGPDPDVVSGPGGAAGGAVPGAGSGAARLRDLLVGAVWGNRADLGFRIGREGGPADEGSLVVDDSSALCAALDSGLGRELCLVADNAGAELLADLALVDHLLATGLSERVDLHVKPYPYFVSDALAADVAECVSVLDGAVRDRLLRAAADGRWTLRTHDFYRAPLAYRHAPADLVARWSAASLTVFKGDLNYRRLVGDAHWPALTPFADVVEYFPGPVAALRTLKCEVVVGLTPETLAALDASGEDWRVTGAHGLLQVAGLDRRPGSAPAPGSREG